LEWNGGPGFELHSGSKTPVHAVELAAAQQMGIMGARSVVVVVFLLAVSKHCSSKQVLQKSSFGIRCHREVTWCCMSLKIIMSRVPVANYSPWICGQYIEQVHPCWVTWW